MPVIVAKRPVGKMRGSPLIIGTYTIVIRRLRMRKTLEQNASITIVENKKITCANCLNSEEGGHPEMVICNLNPEPVEKHISKFCAQGLWLIDGDVKSFKEAFKQIYAGDNVGHPKDLK
jgi:hypothetical protein